MIGRISVDLECLRDRMAIALSSVVSAALALCLTLLVPNLALSWAEHNFPYQYQPILLSAPTDLRAREPHSISAKMTKNLPFINLGALDGLKKEDQEMGSSKPPTTCSTSGAIFPRVPLFATSSNALLRHACRLLQYKKKNSNWGSHPSKY